ncbi:MAG TPA: hypothetical protein VHD85_04835 [Terracidiphilus sp.]|nr:hypothetical protein [Terracidiphilus sp.]
MSESQEELLRSLRRHARINTALQTGALFELEAQRRELATQTSMLEATQQREQNREHDQEILHLWRGWVSDVEEAEGEPVRQFVLLSQVHDLIADIPRAAPLDEVSRAKKLLRRTDGLLDVIRVQEAERVARLEAWWQRNKIEERIRALEPIGDRISNAVNTADRVPDRAIVIERLEKAKHMLISFDEEMLRMEEAENLDSYDRVLVRALHGTDGEFFSRHSSGERSRLLEHFHNTIASLKEAEIDELLAKKRAESQKTATWVVFCISALLFFIFILWIQSQE